MNAGKCITVRDPSAVAEARRAATDLAKSLGFTEPETSNLAIVVTEVATNIHKHAREGMVVLHKIATDDGSGIDVLGLDHGMVRFALELQPDGEPHRPNPPLNPARYGMERSRCHAGPALARNPGRQPCFYHAGTRTSITMPAHAANSLKCRAAAG